MNSKQLAEFYGISTQAVNRWSLEKTNRKTIQAEADVTPLEWQLVGEIAQLVYTYNAKGWEACSVARWAHLSIDSFSISVRVYCDFGAGMLDDGPSIDISAKTSNTAEMQLIKMQLEKLVYGEEK